jgi:DNA-binding beta-propeller fold protein YncE
MRNQHSGRRACAAGALLTALLCLAVPGSSTLASHLSDLNRDGVVSLQDLILFSEKELGQDWRTVNWCAWLRQPHRHEAHVADLKQFVQWYFGCVLEPLAVVNSNDYPTRVAWGPDGKLYVSDAKSGSVFIYERTPALTLVGELKGLDKPLGVAVDAQGNLYVGNDGRDNVEVYDPAGDRLGTIGDGLIRMPNDLEFDAAGDLYVVDSRSNRVWIFDPVTGVRLRDIGEGMLRFPIAVAVGAGEVYVGDQGNAQVKVFDAAGTHLRSLGRAVSQGSLGFKWKGRFIRLQDLALDASGRVHAVDCHMGLIQILNPTTGAFVASYGTQGTEPGQLNLPLGMALNAAGEMAVASTENRRVEILAAP